MPIYAIDGLVSPAGGGDITTAPDITPLCVTAPTVGSYSVNSAISSVARNQAWFRFTPSVSGTLIFDASLSYDLLTGVATGAAYINLFGLIGGHTYPPASSADVYNLGGGTGSMTMTLTAGTHYWIAIWDYRAAGATDFVLRVSDYGAVTPWVQGADQSYVTRNQQLATGQDQSFYPADTVPRLYNSDGTVNGYNVKLPGASGSNAFQGSYNITHAFNGPYPADEENTPGCLWRWARCGAWGSQYWSAYPQGNAGSTAPPYEPASWNGTDPYDSGVLGVGVCATYTGTVESGGSGGRVGERWTSSAITDGLGGGYQNVEIDCWGSVQRFWVRPAVKSLGPAAGQLDPTDGPGGGATLEWSDTQCTLLGVDVAPDYATDATFTGGGVPLNVLWFLRATSPWSEGTAETTWGPYIKFHDGDTSSYKELGFHGGVPTDMSNFLADQPAELPTTHLGGTAPGWTAVDSLTLEQALSNEDAWQEQWDAGVNPSWISWFAGGLRATAFGQDQLSEGLPPLAITTDKPGEADRYVDGALVAYRLRVRPAQHRWRMAPVVPAVEVLVPTGNLDAVRRRFFG